MSLPQQHGCVFNEAILLLSSPQTLKLARSQPSSFILQLAEHPSLLKDMLDIALRPTFFQKQKGQSLTTELPALAIDTLVNLYEQFIDLLVFGKISKKEESLDGFELQGQQPQDMRSEEAPFSEHDKFTLMAYMHLCIVQGQSEDTAYCYLNRVIGPLSYQRPTELMQFYQGRPEVMAAIIGRMDHRGILQLFCRILECEYGKQFFKEYKSKYLTHYLEGVREAVGTDAQLPWLEGLQQVYRFFTEKMEEQADQNKYLSLLQTLQKQELQLLATLNHSLQKGNIQIVPLCLKWVEELLKHDGHVMGNTSVRLSITHMNRKNSISNSFYGDQKIEQRRKYHICQFRLREVLTLAQQVDALYLTPSKPNNAQLLIALYRVLYFFIRIWIHASKDKEIADPQLLTTFVNEHFLDRTLAAVVAHPGNSCLHNCVKEVVIECIREAVVGTIYFYRLQGGYCRMLLDCYPKAKHNLQAPFSQQLYHIYKEVVIAHPHLSQPIENILLSHTQRLNKPIGYDPRKLHQDNLRGSSNAFSESSENMEDILEFDLHSQNSLQYASNKCFGASIVKMHNSTSLERSQLSEVGEQRIVIEGIDQDD